LFISVRSFTLKEAERISQVYKNKYPSSKVSSVKGIIDIFCCYPFINLKNHLEVKNKFSDSLPFPKYELFDSFKILQNNWSNGKWLYPIMTSLGCPYQCTYCQSHNRKWNSRSAKNCYEELKQAKQKYGIKGFTPIDDCFNLSKERVLEFCKLIKPLKLKWICTNGLRADRFDEDIAQAMSQAGCVHVGFGVECLDDPILKNIKKGVNVNQIKKAIKIAKKYFKNVHGFFILGLPGSSYQKDLNSLKWIIKEGINGHFSYHVPFDKNYAGEIFYGSKTKIKSKEYSKRQQRRLYNLTRSMRGNTKISFLLKALDRLKLIWLFDKRNIHKHVWKEIVKRAS
jgi:radical SAM superfamily enzyme YgiQ (UPF0313 family)